MKFEPSGKSISKKLERKATEVSAISPQGVTLLVDGESLLMPFEKFPWFENATPREIFNMQCQDELLYWPDLDIDLALDIVRNPEAYPLVAQFQKVS